jgi:hypothetical protein
VLPAPSPRHPDHPVGPDGQRPSGHRSLLDIPENWGEHHPRKIPPPAASAVPPRARHRHTATIPLHHRPEGGQRLVTFPRCRGRGAVDANVPSLTGHNSPPLSLSPDEEQRLRQFLAEEPPLFDTGRGLTPLAQHEIRLLHQEPVKQRYRPRNPFMQGIIDEEVDKMLAEGVIEPSESPWSSPIVLAKKKDGKYRFCIDFRKVNEVTRKDAHPLPFINVILDKLRRAWYISTNDLKSGYWQVPLTPASKPITAFTVQSRGLYQFRVMPFGLHSAPATFQRLMDRASGQSWQPASGIRTDLEKVAAIQQLTTPKTPRQVRRFLGRASWYRRFIPDFSRIAAPLNRLLKKGIRWE